MNTKTDIHLLNCGIPLLMSPRDDVPVATADVWVRTGAADEPLVVSGISHFLEHMLFKGTERWGLGEIERRLESVGGVCNAGTSYDFTHYYMTMPTPALTMGIEMLADMVRSSTLDTGELEKERLVILEEYRRKQDHPAGVLYENLYASFFAQGPYHASVIGTEESIRAIDRTSMHDYFQRRYSPANMVFVVAGTFDRKTVIDAAEQAFAGFDRPLGNLHTPQPISYGYGKHERMTKKTGGESYIAFALPAPGTNTDAETILALDMAQYILGQGRAALLHRELKEKRGLCSSISAYYPTHMRDSLFAAIATCEPGQCEALREGVYEVIEAFTKTPPKREVFERARRLLASGHRFSLETSSGVASALGYYYTMTGSTAFHDDYLEHLAALTPERVCECFAEQCTPRPMREIMTSLAVGPEPTPAGGSDHE